ncbi:MAG: type IV secretory system conjugative DNA transfer family protein [Spirirestis rafaelensis WJT71-NPBG6]|jgi:energy-coupling factor transporter ATP-binding protein EcfA2|nr:type IV secretory system conjugative DNA transfer family protein [Spirirestis rafaelensis WJT71-NPBG6]
MFNNSFIQDLINYRNNSKLITVISFASCGLCFISAVTIPNGFTKVTVTLLGLLNSFVGIRISREDNNLSTRLEDLQLTYRATSKELLAGYLKDNSIEVTVPVLPISEADVITDIVSYWQSQEKHLALVGGTGDGKSFTMKLFVSALQNEYSIAAYDVDFAKDDYPDCVDVKYSYQEIEAAFIEDMEELENRIEARRPLGKRYNPDKKLIIGEEMPALAEECDSLGLWMRKMSKRGRKVGLFIAAIAQNDTAENFALKGDASILKSNFCLLYLGNKAKTRAKQLKNPALEEWLNGASKGRGLIDDKACIIGASNFLNPSSALPIEEIKDSAETPGSATKSGVEAPEGGNFTPQFSDYSEEEKLVRARKLRAEGYSKTKIIKLLWEVEGGAKFTELSKLID